MKSDPVLSEDSPYWEGLAVRNIAFVTINKRATIESFVCHLPIAILAQLLLYLLPSNRRVSPAVTFRHCGHPASSDALRLSIES